MFTVENNACGQTAVVLLGRINTGADQMCFNIKEGLMKGEVQINIEHDTMSFVFAGAVLSFQEDVEKLSNINQIFARGNVQLEQRLDSNYAGFEIFQASR